MATLTQRKLKEFRSRLEALPPAGSIEITDMDVQPRLDANGEEYAQVTLTVTEPPPGQETWSLDDAFERRQGVRRAAMDMDLPAEVAITITSSGPSETDDEPE